MSEPTIAILGFEPLQIELPATLAVETKIRVRLPPVHLKLFDLSMGGLIPDSPHIGADVPFTEIVIDVEEPTTVGQIVDTIVASAGEWRAVWELSQKFLDDYGPVCK